MSRHRIFGTEADQPRPLAYIRIYPSGRKRVSRYLVAAVLGGIFTLVAAVVTAVLNGALLVGGG